MPQMRLTVGQENVNPPEAGANSVVYLELGVSLDKYRVAMAEATTAVFSGQTDMQGA